MQITTDKRGLNWLKANGKRVRVFISAGPWLPGAAHPDQIKLRPRSRYFPEEIVSTIKVENNSDSREDYFEADCIRLIPGDALYDAAKAAA